MVADEWLVARVADGDESALRELLQRYQRPLCSFLHRQTGGREVDDLYQETWLRVVKHAGRFDGGKRFSTWLFQIAVNLGRDWHRRRGGESLSDGIGASDSTDVFVAADQVEATLDAQALLALLPEAQREVLILRFYHDLSEQEIADIVGCPRGTVKSRLHHALARLSATERASI
ncbi:MAG TPA: sigma-70 family RNA polymerase sigma factor [Terriglobales bacterium]|nr:sigma-70 family RNA polymerase sigma factor [Terriglobales bacterium]